MFKQSVRSLLVLGAALVGMAGAQAANPKICVWDIIGANGDQANAAKDYALAMQKDGVDLDLKFYTDEHVAVEDFRTGQCDGVMATGFRLRPFNPVSTSIDDLGSTTIVRNGKIDMEGSYDAVLKAIEIFSSAKAEKLMTNGDYEVAGIVTLGPVFPFNNDRRINSVEALAGKRLASMDYDRSQATMIQKIGAQPVSVDIMTVGPKFNNGSVDVIFLPAVAYRPMELYKGLGAKGSIARFPVLFSTIQMVIKKDRFPAGFGQKSRDYWVSQFGHFKKMALDAEKTIPAHYWMDLPQSNAVKYTLMLRDSRIDLAKKGMYDKTGLKILKKVRCSINPSDSECASNSEIVWN